MKKMSLVMTVMMASSLSYARGGTDVGTGTQPQKINCEYVEFTASKNAEAYKMDSSELALAFAKDGEIDQRVGKIDIFGGEDNDLKGLYQITLTSGDAPMSDDNGTALSVLLKKSEVMTASDWEDHADSSLLNVKAKSAKVQTYAVVHDMNLAGVATVSFTNKFFKALRDANIRTSYQTMMIDGMTLLEKPEVKKIIQSKFAQGELLMIGLNHACIATP